MEDIEGVLYRIGTELYEIRVQLARLVELSEGKKGRELEIQRGSGDGEDKADNDRS